MQGDTQKVDKGDTKGGISIRVTVLIILHAMQGMTASLLELEIVSEE